MFITDVHVHIWEASTPERPWPPGRNPPHRPVPFSKDDLLREMDAAGVQRAVLVPPSWVGEQNDLVLEAARAHADRFAVTGLLDIDAPEARRQFSTWRQQPGMLGLRVNFKIQGNPADSWLWPQAEAAGVPVMVSVSTTEPQLPLLAQAAARYPGLKLAIDHLGIPKGNKDDEWFAHLDKLLALAKCPNIALKVSALPTYTNDTYPYRRLHPALRRIYDAFGPKRMLWGSDITRLPCSYRQSITMFTEEIPWLTSQDKEWIMGRATCEWIGWKMP